MTIEQIFIQLEAINAELNVIRHSEGYMKPNNWYVAISWKHDGSELRVKKEASVFYDTLNDAWEEFDRIANRGLPLARLAAPLEPKDYGWENEVDYAREGAIAQHYPKTDDDLPF